MKAISNSIARLVGTVLLLSLAMAPDAWGGEQSMDQMWGESIAKLDVSNSERGQLFRDGNYAMFIHWGLYSHLGGKWKDRTYYGIGEWIMNRRMAGIPVDEYKAIASEFNPTNFDARAIARLARDAGMKYIVITSKHHDGFAMFHSKVDPFNVVDATPFARDPMKELADACREAGLGFGFYYSHFQDWTAPGGGNGPATHPDGTPATFEEYFRKKCLPQVREICTGYGPLEIVWFDTPGGMEKRFIEELHTLVRETQPGALLCSRIGHGLGDYASKGDMEVPPRNIEGLWETCDTSNDSWSYAWYDENWKSPREILHRLTATVGRGGTYLFNVGPDGSGRIPELSAQFLREAGEWIARYPQVIYSADPSPWGHALPWGDVTVQGSTLLLSVFDWPADGRLYLPGLKTDIVSAQLLKGRAGPVSVSHQRRGTWTVLNVPATPPDHPASVIALKLAGNAEVDGTHGLPPRGELTLLAEFAEVSGAEKRRLNWMEKFGEWKFATQVGKWSSMGSAVWTLDVFEPGNYQVWLNYRGEGRLVWAIATEGASIQNQQGAASVYHWYPMGVLRVNSPGPRTITVSLVDGDRQKASLEAIRIRRVE